jgi:DNA-directed RNA polymerase subunit RPC12/RpoP
MTALNITTSGTSIDRMLEQRKEAEEIKCPYCEAIQPNEDCQYPTTYWGDDGAVELECVECEKKFWVEELVERTYNVGKALDCNGCIVEES